MATAAVSSRVIRGLGGITKSGGKVRSLDYLVIGGGYAGCNALSALQRSVAPGSSVLCASLSPPGGSWYDYYDYAKLHAPHPQFGVSGQPWDISDPNVLASKDQVIDHFNQYVSSLPTNFEFASGVEFVKSEYDCRDDISLVDKHGSGVRATLRDVATGEESTVSAKYVIDARGYHFTGHRSREEDLNFTSSDVPETQVSEVTAKMAEVDGAVSKRSRL